MATTLDSDASDPDLVNAWGISSSPTSPFWVSDNGTGKSTLYSINGVTNGLTKAGLVVSIPGDGTPTGQVFNSGSSFHGDLFLFASEDGTISGWRPALGSSAETLQVGSASNVYKGLAISNISGNSYLYAANFRTGAIDVIKGAGAPSLTGTFVDPTIPAGYAPFNVQNINGTLYVTYALQDGTKHDDVAGAGHGFVDAFDLNGNLIGRVGSQGTLDSPWGLAQAPSNFGALSNDLLVGNFGDGTISLFNPTTDAFLGQIVDGATGDPLSIDGLWGLTFGNGASGGSKSKIYFTAGPNNEGNGRLGVLTTTPEPGSMAMLCGMAASAGVFAIRRKARRR